MTLRARDSQAGGIAVVILWQRRQGAEHILSENERRVRMTKLYLSRTDKKIAGVCGGIGETYDVDPTLVRLAFVFADLITGVIPLLLVYIVAWIIIPQRPPE